MMVVDAAAALDLPLWRDDPAARPARSPIDGAAIGSVIWDDAAALDQAIAQATAAFASWRTVPAPRRGELIRLFAEELRAAKAPLAALVSAEAGKITSEALGEVQEMIDMADFAVGLSRQLYGLDIASERPDHRMMELWRPLGVVGCISAFNFPVAVWAWNFCLAIVCGDPVVWKPSEKTPLTALACQNLFQRACARFGDAPTSLSAVVLGDGALGARLVDDPRVALISATGSTAMGRAVGPRVAARFGRSLLELGGNNAMIVCPSADLDLTYRAALFAVAGASGQRCTSLRRLLIHESVADELIERLAASFARIPIGDPRDPGVLMGPLIDRAAFEQFEAAKARAVAEGGRLRGGERIGAERFPDAYYVRPALVAQATQTPSMLCETFAPLLSVTRWRELDAAIAMNNAVDHGLSSCIFTNDLREAEQFLSAAGSDCGIVNVNIGPSGAEIGGAFGGEKASGGGREAGSDAWKSYMRQVTATVNYGRALPLAQGVRFDLD